MSLGKLAFARIRRHPLRSLTTALGVMAVAALATGSLHLSMAGREIKASSPGEPLVVMQEGRICPSTSHLPREWGDQVAGVDGVANVLPQQVVVSNCKVSTTATTFRGVPPDIFNGSVLPNLTVIDGNGDAMGPGSAQALVGSQVAQSQGLKVGQTLESAGISVTVAGIVDGPRMQDRASVWVDYQTLEKHLPALAGTTTLFEVALQPGVDGEAVGQAIDATLQGTDTAPFSATAARVAGSLADVLEAAGWVAMAAIVAGLLLIGNAAILGLRAASRDLGVLRAIGHPVRSLAAVVGVEGALTGFLGGLVGSVGAAVVVASMATAISTEGISVVIDFRPTVVILVVLGSVLCGMAASAIPGWYAARAGLRTVLSGGD